MEEWGGNVTLGAEGRAERRRDGEGKDGGVRGERLERGEKGMRKRERAWRGAMYPPVCYIKGRKC